MVLCYNIKRFDLGKILGHCVYNYYTQILELLWKYWSNNADAYNSSPSCELMYT